MRIDGYAPIEDYAAIGDGRTVALVARDGSIDWLCLPNIDSPSTFAAILDADRGGTFELQPVEPFVTTRRYVPDTNLLETTFRTASGEARVVDALTLPGAHLEPMRELARAVEGVSGRIQFRWRVAPRFDYGARVPRFVRRGGVPVAADGRDALGICHWTGGTMDVLGDSVEGTFTVGPADRALLALIFAMAEPLVLPARSEVDGRLAETARFWRGWAADRRCAGPWADAVRRSALALKLLIFAPSGASAAAPTTSLPEALGGTRNWDYRYCWIRDSNFMIDALLALGCYPEAQSLFWWFMQATALTEPDIHVLYRLDGGPGDGERELPLAGYRRSRPVRAGNAAAGQEQHDIYGALFETAFLYSEGHHSLDRDTGVVLGRIADHVCDIWRAPDSGIWEVRNGPFHFTHSKVMCWVALNRASQLAARGELPRRHAGRWDREAAAIVEYVETRCWSDTLRSYTRTAEGEPPDQAGVDASLLTLPLLGYGKNRPDRINATIDAVSHRLRRGEFVYRYRAEDGIVGAEGCFLNASFWLAGALARMRRLEEARSLMTALIARANDVQLYSEEIDPRTGAFLGNFPQALVHLSLIIAAVAIARAEEAA